MAKPSDVMQALQQRNLGRLRMIFKTEPELARAQVGGLSALLLACYLRNQEAIELLLANDALVSIHEAAVLDDADSARAMLQKDPACATSLSADGFAPLHLAAHFGAIQVLDLLLASGIPVAPVGSNPMANTPLHGAASGGQAGSVARLVAAGHPVDARDSGGNTPLMVAAANGSVEAVGALVVAGADLTLRNKAGRTAKELALDKGQRATAALLG